MRRCVCLLFAGTGTPLCTSFLLRNGWLSVLLLGSGWIPHIRIFEFSWSTASSLLIHKLIVVRRLVLVILVVPRILKVILNFLWHMMVLKGLEPALTPVISRRSLWLTSTESFSNSIQICDRISVIVTALIPTRCWLVATFLMLTAPSSLHLLLSLSAITTSSHLLNRQWSFILSRYRSFLTWNLIQALFNHRIWVLKKQEISVMVADHIEFTSEIFLHLTQSTL